MFQFVPTSLNQLTSLRNSYLNTLIGAQDMYSESLISWMPGETCYLINKEDETAGYLILNSSHELAEFYIQDRLLTRKEAVFSALIEQFNIKSVYCKSFDHVLLSCCHQFSKGAKLVGYLFQDYNRTDIVPDSRMEVRLASMEDVPYLNSFENELLEEGEEIDSYVKNNSVYMFTKAGELIGCGYLFNVIAGRRYHDVGMWVNQPFRRQGYGTQIILYLMNYCFENGFIPTAGCAEDNYASRLTLEKCGFITKYCLINFEF